MKEKKAKYYLKKNGEFIIENYNFAKPFASFFPGIAGKYGIPMWVFYVNRGQGIASCGTRDKNHSILEFYPANKAWQLATMRGFRTFIKIKKGKSPFFYEPFHNGFSSLGFNLNNKMSVTPWDLKIEEENSTLGLTIKVEYFTIPQDSYAALARIVTIKNDSKTDKNLQVFDGLPQITPFGINNLFLKNLNRTIEAWMKVENMQESAPVYKIDVDPIDRPQVIHIKECHFYLAFHEQRGKALLLKPLVDPDCIFGPVTDFSCPQRIIAKGDFFYPRQQALECKTPCAFSMLDIALEAKEEKMLYSLTGYISSKEALNSSLPKIANRAYIESKKEENKEIIQKIQEDIKTSSSCLKFDLYAQQTYLDNIMRGGYPLPLDLKNGRAIFYLYSRKHGDLERDYNKFQLQATYFSQGNGNYRDVNQNRRMDAWFNPAIKEENLVALVNLIQSDGFNPLVVRGASFTIKDMNELKDKLGAIVAECGLGEIMRFLNSPFTPGELFAFIERNNIKLNCSYDDFIPLLLSCSEYCQEAEYKEGFWTDHWAYNLDLLENYLCLYPETAKELIFLRRDFTFYDNCAIVRPRQQKYMLLDGQPRQLDAVFSDPQKSQLINSRPHLANLARRDYGKGEIYQTTLINKLLCLVANKLSSLDPSGAGIEMEANKPNWYDALNGLPALFGSSSNETFELKRLLIFIRDELKKNKVTKVGVSGEIYTFLKGLAQLIEDYLKSKNLQKDYEYWQKSSFLREEYRAKTRLGFSGEEAQIPAEEINIILNKALEKVDLAIESSRHPKAAGIYYAYFINLPQTYAETGNNFINPLSFKQKPLPLFLESQVHALRLASSQKEAREIYAATKKSALFDKKLKMYKVSAPLKDAPLEIGRCRAFTPGWLENESIWMHMDYKYLLELLKQGLYKEFYEDFKNILIPFQNPARYGRNILENSSFLVSSSFPDKKLHGNGYVARLSGSTAEFLNIWLLMSAGKEPFFLNCKGELNLRFFPLLAGWLFKKDGTYAFNFLSKVLVTYRNPKRKDTFGASGVQAKKINFQDKNGKPIEITSNTIPSPFAEEIRSRQITAIDIFLG